MESLDKLGFEGYVPVCEALMRKLSECASAASAQECYRKFLQDQ